MRNLMVFLATGEPSPGGDLREGLDPEAVTPGTLGFLATLFVVVITFFLIRDMNKRVRRVRYREQVQEEAARAEALRAEETAVDNDGGTAADRPAAGSSPLGTATPGSAAADGPTAGGSRPHDSQHGSHPDGSATGRRHEHDGPESNPRN